MKIGCPYYIFVSCSDAVLCGLYNKFKIDGREWAHYPLCKEGNCPFMHHELLGDKIWISMEEE